MSKYYIICGSLQYIVSSKSIEDAIKKFVQDMHGKGIMLGPTIYVDEKGFNKTYKYSTDKYLKDK
jgi:hypothetical protein